MMSAGGKGGDGGGADGSKPERRLPLPARARVTLQTTGVTPLVLPDDEGRPSLELDTSELPAPPVAAEAEATPVVPMPKRPSLELDLEDIELAGAKAPAPDAAKRVPATDPPAHDAWTQDRLVRRGTPPVPFAAAEAEKMPGVRVMRAVVLPSEVPPVLHSAAAGGALDLVERAHSSAAPEIDFATEMSERFALGDFTGALLAAELLLGRDANHEAARRVAAASHDRLVALYTSRLGSLDRAPRVVLPDHEIRWLGLDNRSGFLLSRIDGKATVEEIIDMSGMARLEALRTLSELIAVGVVAL